ncbi:isoamylase early set domain-containing protein [Vibrio sp. WXL103]|uniref:isoamylase early set domain-containing protein n=1 Tax=unclassified Vibrio TaxID=2614977 RepID=UPI003EC4D93A
MFTKRFFKTKNEVEVTFQWPKGDSDVKTVAISGDFNDWQATPLKLNRQKVFTTKIRLPKDAQFQFRYVLDDSVWENDHQADAYVPNGQGSDNSVISTYQEVEA